MKKILFATVLVLLPSAASATCSGVFQPGTICGNNSASPKIPFEIPGSTGLVGPGTSTVGDLALWNNITGSSLKDQAPAALTGANDTNVTLTMGGNASTALVNAASVTAGWTGTLAAGRLNANVVQSVVNDTNVTGSIATQALTLGWTGTLAAGRLNSNVVQSFVNDTNVTASVAAQAATLGWTGTLALTRGGTGAATQSAAAANIFPTPTRAGDIVYWNGSAWTTLAGNNSGTQVLQENVSGVPSWATIAGTGTVTSITCGTGLSGGTITNSGTCAVNLTASSNSLGSDTALNNTSNYFDGPSVAQGTSGSWSANGTVTLTDTAGSATYYCKLWDGTTVISSGATNTVGANGIITMSLSGTLMTPAANIKVSCKDITSTSGKILFNASGNSKDSTLTLVRIN